jgi:hypothetical protein
MPSIVGGVTLQTAAGWSAEAPVITALTAELTFRDLMKVSIVPPSIDLRGSRIANAVKWLTPAPGRGAYICRRWPRWIIEDRRDDSWNHRRQVITSQSERIVSTSKSVPCHLEVCYGR